MNRATLPAEDMIRLAGGDVIECLIGDLYDIDDSVGQAQFTGFNTRDIQYIVYQTSQASDLLRNNVEHLGTGLIEGWATSFHQFNGTPHIGERRPQFVRDE